MFQTRLFVGNLPDDVHESDLRSAFSDYGEVVNLDIKTKSNVENDPKKFAFVTISGGNNDVETCIKYFSNNDFKGSRLYVTRARESFLERLQREREQADKKIENNDQTLASKTHPVIKLGDKLNPKKRKSDATQSHELDRNLTIKKSFERNSTPLNTHIGSRSEQNVSTADKKRQEADKKRMESMQKKRQEFKNKQNIIKTGLIGIDKIVNKKKRFSDDEEVEIATMMKHQDLELKPVRQNTLFDDDDDESDGEVNFEIKKQYEGKKGQKVLDLQSRYKSDKRFVLDERFIEGDHADDGTDNEKEDADEDPSGQIEVSLAEEKSKQFEILEDLLGVAIKPHVNKSEKDRKAKPNMGMIRFDPMNPEHAKFVVPMEAVKHESKKAKKSKKQLPEPDQTRPEAPKVEVSKEQFYKSEITKEAFLQPATGFSLRSLFAKDEDSSKDQVQEDNDMPLQQQQQKQPKVKNPLDPGEKNPFVYDSSESEDEGDATKDQQAHSAPEAAEVKAVWRENLFFSKDDSRLTDGLDFFNNVRSREAPKERRELKSVMMKRIHNTERKNQMFKKKIGGRKKSMKKSYKKKS